MELYDFPHFTLGESEFYGDDSVDIYLLKIYFSCITRQRKCRIRKLNETFWFLVLVDGMELPNELLTD